MKYDFQNDSRRDADRTIGKPRHPPSVLRVFCSTCFTLFPKNAQSAIANSPKALFGSCIRGAAVRFHGTWAQ